MIVGIRCKREERDGVGGDHPAVNRRGRKDREEREGVQVGISIERGGRQKRGDMRGGRIKEYI